MLWRVGKVLRVVGKMRSVWVWGGSGVRGRGEGGGRGGGVGTKKVMKIMKCNKRAGRGNNNLIGRYRQTLGPHYFLLMCSPRKLLKIEEKKHPDGTTVL